MHFRGKDLPSPATVPCGVPCLASFEALQLPRAQHGQQWAERSSGQHRVQQVLPAMTLPPPSPGCFQGPVAAPPPGARSSASA